ncbi:MAG: outer membrane lipoprotein LolB [Burkholderiaceae bacterium]|nr:outer membrane lipoprotein LolB [Burkholderiaceae bacterium]
MNRPAALPSRRLAISLPLAGAVLWLAGCAAPRTSVPRAGGTPDNWSGRMALRVESNPPQSLSAAFDLKGTADAGELSLATPLGSILARLTWGPEGATLHSGNETRRYASVDELLASVTGTPVPVTALFEWLSGRPATAQGWQADLSSYADGRLQARREAPAPAADLRLIFENVP